MVGQRVKRFDEPSVGEGATARASGVKQGFRKTGRGDGEQSRTAWRSGNPLRKLAEGSAPKKINKVCVTPFRVCRVLDRQDAINELLNCIL